MMIEFEVKIQIDCAREGVTEALMNPANFVHWTKYLERFEVVEGKPGEAGAVARLHYLQNGQRYVMEDRLIECEPGKRYLSRVTGDAVEATVETLLKSDGEKTEMELRWSGRGRKGLVSLLLKLGRRRMVKQSVGELKVFKTLVETRGSSFERT